MQKWREISPKFTQDYIISVQIPVTRLAPFEQFMENYHPLQMKGVYKRAVIAAIKVNIWRTLQLENLIGN